MSRGLDDLVIVPLGILVAAKLVPPALMAEFREAAGRIGGRPHRSLGRVDDRDTTLRGLRILRVPL